MLSDILNTRRLKWQKELFLESKQDDWKVIRDQYGIGITDDYWIDRPLVEVIIRAGVRMVELIATREKKEFRLLVASGAITIKEHKKLIDKN